MIVDASALLAVVFDEDGWERFADAMLAAARCRMSAVNWLEATIQVDKRDNPVIGARFEEIVRDARIEIAEVTRAQAQAAREAWRSYGRGNHRARLNLGDCFAYALAKTEADTLLFKGGDFPQTDIASALPA